MVNRLIPGAQAPSLTFETLTHGTYDLRDKVPPSGTFLAFHRGSHCKWTRNMLKELDDRIGDFALRGIRVVAISSLGREAVEALKDKMQLIRLPLGFGLDVATTARDWGLYLTQGSTEPEAPPLHWEPAQVWVRPDGRIGTVAVQSGPNLWSDATNTIRAIENTNERFPERGAGP